MKYLIRNLSEFNNLTSSQAGEALVKELCRAHLSIEPTLAKHKSGKPYLKNSNYCVSISHSAQRVMCSINKNEIGVDIQKITPYDSRLIDRFFVDEEIAFAKKDSESFFKVWSTKEAVSKISGEGLKSFKHFCVVENDQIKASLGDTKILCFLDNTCEGSYAVAIAWVE